MIDLDVSNGRFREFAEWRLYFAEELSNFRVAERPGVFRFGLGARGFGFAPSGQVECGAQRTIWSPQGHENFLSLAM